MNKLYNSIINKEHHIYRQDFSLSLAKEYAEKKFSPEKRISDRFKRLMTLETPHILPEQTIVFLRTVVDSPDIFTEEEWTSIKSENFIHELGYISNLCPNYSDTIALGLIEIAKNTDEYTKIEIDSIIELCDRYCEEARKQGLLDIAATLEHIPRYGARTFYEALQFLRILHFSLWREGTYHNTLGRIDKYLYPYIESDLSKKILDHDQVYKLLKEFFLVCNLDSDLYPGVQQGDNGQSVMLGGDDGKGGEIWNILSEFALNASEELHLIDPKINIRVSKKTPLEIFEKGTRLTAAGLGFPQYSNDDVIIPGLTKLGYNIDDARDYTVAACWETIIPNSGFDIVNIGALSYPKVVEDVLRKQYGNCDNIDDFYQHIDQEIANSCEKIISQFCNIWFIPSPIMNMLFKCDLSKGAKYNNFGIHGTGLSCAADSISAIEKVVFDEKRYTLEEILHAIQTDFQDEKEMLHILRYESPKIGQNIDKVDIWAVKLMKSFQRALDGKVNSRGGCFRPGTGSAMFYLRHAEELGGSPDGRRKGEAFSANYSPSLFAKVDDPIAIVQSFTKADLSQIINGGPLTLEFSSSMFGSADSIDKIATLIKYYVDKGGHQLQLNAINRNSLLSAQKNPDQYRNLIVRIWGWSAYFVELDLEFQNHVLSRQEYVL